jgi:hypothetical protein
MCEVAWAQGQLQDGFCSGGDATCWQMTKISLGEVTPGSLSALFQIRGDRSLSSSILNV